MSSELEYGRIRLVAVIPMTQLEGAAKALSDALEPLGIYAANTVVKAGEIDMTLHHANRPEASRKLRSSKGLPVPRLELRWDEIGRPKDFGTFRRNCRYLLVMPITRYDIRTDARVANADGTALEFEFGTTSCGGGDCPRVFLERDQVDMPYRDGSHAAWDSFNLKIPAYATCGEHAMFIEPREPSA